MKKFTVFMCAIVLSMGARGNSLRNLWISMPDTLVPSLDKNLRTELVELQEMGIKSEVNNLLGSTSVMDTITHDFLQVKLSALNSLQIKFLPLADGDSVLCVVKTVAAPEKESEVSFYDQEWRLLDAKHFFGGKSLSEIRESLIQRPDTMSERKFSELKTMIEPRMLSATLFEQEKSIVFRLSLPLLSDEDKKLISVIRVQRKFNWNGKTFNEG